MKDLICSIQTKEANKAVEIAQEGNQEDDKSSSSGSDSNPSADELDVSFFVPSLILQKELIDLLHGNILHVVNNFSKVLTEGVPKIDISAKKAKAIALRQAEQRAPPMPKDLKK